MPITNTYSITEADSWSFNNTAVFFGYIETRVAKDYGNWEGWTNQGFMKCGGGADNITVTANLYYGPSGVHATPQAYGGEIGWVIEAGGGNDTIRGYTLDDFIKGEDGYDNLYGGGGNDTLWGGTGADTLYGEAGNDILNGDDGDDTLYGGDDNDELTGDRGADRLYGGAGNDTLRGTTVLTTLNYDYEVTNPDSADTLVGGMGDDFYVVDATADQVTEQANEGVDTIEALYVDAITLVANVENLFLGYRSFDGTGNALDNTMTGNDLANTMEGLDGADTLRGLSGADHLYGGNGGDRIEAGSDDDWVYGEAGADTLFGDAGVDFIYAGIDADYASGGTGDDFIYGEAGADTLLGGDGIDRLYGGADNDTIQGGDGNDRIWGDGGRDNMYGEAGFDTFVFRSISDSTVSAFDIIRDFVEGTDRIDLSGIDANTLLAGNQSFNFAGDNPMFVAEQDLWTRATLTGTLVEGDVNGDSLADFRILVSGTSSLGQSSFIL